MKKKSIWITLIFIIALGSGAYFIFFKTKTPEVQYRFEKITRGNIQVVVTATGTLSAVTTVQVGSQVSGTIAKLYADFNSKVKQGQVVAQIDPTFLEASVRDAEANLQRTLAQANEAQRAFNRVKIMLEKNLASQADYDAALTQQESTIAAKKQAEAQLERAKINLRYATIRAPIDGVVISRQVDVGQTVAASFSAPTIFTIANDLTKMQVQANVDEADIGKVKESQDVSFTVDAYPEQTFRGTVRLVRLASVTVQNVVNYTVIIDVPNEDLKLLPGMTATVSIHIEQKENVLKVPTVALRFSPPQDQIEIRRDSSGSGNTQEDSARAERRKQFTQRMQQDGGGTMDPQAMQKRMAARGVGRLWVLNKNKKLEPIVVRTGLMDGTFTEIQRGKIEEGQEVVVGAIQQKPSNSSTPFSPQQGGGGMGGRGGRN